MLASKQREMITLKELTWQDVREDVKAVNPTLFNIIEQLSPSKKLVLYKIRYPYGANIIENGCFNLITEDGETVSLNDERVSKQIKNALSYRSIPLALVLHNASEVFIEDDDRIVPMRLLKPGELFGVFEALDPPDQEASASVTSVSAGARSAFMLAKISDKSCHKRLVKELGLRSHLPKGLADHGLVFAEIGSHKQFATQWYNEILFFSDEWLRERNGNAGWANFINYLHKVAWSQSQFWRTLTTFGLLWKTLIKAITDRNIRPRPYLVDTIKHLIFLVTGSVPGFTPTGTSELALPSKIIQDVYINSYLLKSHSPIIMVPHHFSLEKPDISIYYSLSYPTLLEYSLNPKQTPTIVEDMREIKLLMHLLDNRLRLKNDHTCEIMKKVIFDYFTCEPDVQGKITPSSELPSLDKKLYDENRTFPSTSTFLRGCIRIANKY